MLAYLAPRANWPAIFLLVAACSYDASGLVTAGATTTSTSASTGDSSSTTAPTTTPPTSTDGSGTDSVTGTTDPIDPSTSTGTSTGTTGPDLTTGTTDPGTDTGTTTGSTTDPGTSTGSTTDPDTTSTTGTTGTTGDSTSTGGDSTSTGGDVCEDTGMEPNETEATAVDLGDQHCKADPKNFAGVLSGAADVDWYTYHGVFSGQGCNMMSDPDPVANSVLTASDTVRMCVFADCDMSNASITCPGGTMMTMSPGGHPGCCGSASMMFTVNCAMNNNESAQVYIRLDQAPADACVDYDVDYSYHN